MIIRPARPADAAQMSAILNEIIGIGGTTAYLTPVSECKMLGWMAKDGTVSSWQVAEKDGSVIGYQSAEPHPKLPPEAVTVASYVKIGTTGLGVGGKLFTATQAACRALGYRWINATIRADNTSGLTYYGKMGFIDWHIDADGALSDGTVTGKISKRFDL